MKFFKILSIVLLAIIALFFVVGAFLPSTGTFERSYKIDAPANMVENEVINLYQDHLWPIWNTQDTSIVYTQLENSLGYKWEGNLVGEGKCEYNLVSNLSIQDHVSFQGKDIAETLWTLTPGQDTELKIVFTVFAGGNIGAKWTNLFLDKLMGDEIDLVISNLRSELQASDL